MPLTQYSLAGINEKVELGKDGHILDATNAGYVKVADNAEALIRVKGAAAQASDEFVVKTQLDAVHALAGGYLSYGYDASQGISQLATQGSGEAGAIRYGDTYKVSVSGTFLGQSAQAGDLVTALVAGADVADNTASNTDWMLIEIRTASDLADGVSTDHSGGKLIVRDAGISTDKLGPQVVTEPKMADLSVGNRSLIDRGVTGVKVGLGTLTDENHANNTITKGKFTPAVQATLTNADSVYATEIPNLEAMIGASVNLAVDSVVPAHSNYATSTTLHGQIAQLDTYLKNYIDSISARKHKVVFDGGAQNIGSPIASGRVIHSISVKPITLANGTGCTMSVGIEGNTSKYAEAIDIDLYGSAVDVFFLGQELTGAEQIIVTVSQGTATQGEFLVTVNHV